MMLRSAAALMLLSSSAAIVFAKPVEPRVRDDPSSYVRVTEGVGGVVTLALRSRVRVPEKGEGPRIHLVGAVHIADKSFYSQMQAMLDRCDVVLFEGVRPPGLGKIDSNLDPAAKADATKKRMRFLTLHIEQFR